MRSLVGMVVVMSLACTGGPEGASTEAPPTEAAPATAEGGTPPAVAGKVDLEADGLVDAAAAFNGGRIFDPDGEVSVNHAYGWIDRLPDNAWVCHQAQKCDVVIEFAEPYDLETLVLVAQPSAAAPPKRVVAEVGPSREGPWTEIASVTPASGTAPQVFPAKSAAARFVRVRFAEWADEYAGLDDVQLRGRRTTPFAASWTGSWQTSTNNFVHLVQSGDVVTGCVNEQPISGVAEGTVLTATLARPEGDPLRDRVVLNLTPEGGIRGVWGEATDAPGVFNGRWDAEPIAPSEPKCEPRPSEPSAFEADLADDGRIRLYGVYFDFDKDTLKPASDKELASLATALAGREGRFRIEGHTDNKGGDAYNQDLSERRAKAVVKWLVDHGVPADRLDTQGFGAGSPVATNDTVAGRSLNRRVEVAIVQ